MKKLLVFAVFGLLYLLGSLFSFVGGHVETTKHDEV
jgi:hypothetical protein